MCVTTRLSIMSINGPQQSRYIYIYALDYVNGSDRLIALNKCICNFNYLFLPTKHATHSFIYIRVRSNSPFSGCLRAIQRKYKHTSGTRAFITHQPIRYERIHNTHSSLTSHSFRTIGTTSTISNTNNNRRRVYYRTLFPFGFRLRNILNSRFLAATYLFCLFAAKLFSFLLLFFFLISNHTRMVCEQERIEVSTHTMRYNK